MRAFPRSGALLRRLAGSGLSVVLASSAPAEHARFYRRAVDADEALSAVTTSDDVDVAKPAPDLPGVAMEKGGVDPARAVMVGDTVWDVQAAAKAGLPCVGLLTGGISRAELSGAGAVAVYADPAQLLDRLDDSPLARLAG